MTAEQPGTQVGKARALAAEVLGAEYVDFFGTASDTAGGTGPPGLPRRASDKWVALGDGGATPAPGGWPDDTPVPSWWTPDLPWKGAAPQAVLFALPDGPERRLLLNLLAGWVEAQADVWHLGGRVLPPCWLRHPRLVVLLFAAWRSYLATTNVRADPRQHIVAAQDWAWVLGEIKTEAETESGSCVAPGGGGHREPLTATHRAARIEAAQGGTDFPLSRPAWPDRAEAAAYERG
ncbi:MAG: hypothetical protein LBK95_19840 [Bifidobacteriaceae bacterium]|jgi:hypothetical protein|nr:hypothetical protein [Bifidobacteriaceae bacterium]